MWQFVSVDNALKISFDRKSKEEYDSEKKQQKQEDEELMVIIGISKVENARLQASMKNEQEKLNEVYFIDF